MADRTASILTSYYRKTLGYMASVTWEEGIRSEGVAERCGVDTMDVLLRRKRLQWVGIVKRKGQEEPLCRILELKGTESHPRGRPKKKWSKIVETDMRLVGASEIYCLSQMEEANQPSNPIDMGL